MTTGDRMSGQADYVLVPREPTAAMIVAGGKEAAIGGEEFSASYNEVVAMRCWTTMLSAAPASPQPQGTEREKLLEKALANAHEVFAAEIEALHRQILTPTPTDEWRRAVEACARVAEQLRTGVAIEIDGRIMPLGILSHDLAWAQKQNAVAIAAAIRALSPTKPDDGWRTMESAPKDGTNVLGGVAGLDRSTGEMFWWEGGWRTWDSENRTRTVMFPTHWRPLPAPPHTKEGE